MPLVFYFILSSNLFKSQKHKGDKNPKTKKNWGGLTYVIATPKIKEENANNTLYVK